jgi:nucleotide-binding universal stress UspA family protein
MSGYTVLLPLDGDKVSEDALLVLPMLRTIGFTKLRIIAVDDPKTDKTPTAEGFRPYVEAQVAAAAAAGWQVESIIATGDPATTIIAEAGDSDVDLIVLATHGRTGIKRMRLGSVSDKIIKDATCPRLVVGPNVDIDLNSYSLQRILVPVDGSDLSEMSLPIARHLARLTGASVDLIQSVSPPVSTAEVPASYPSMLFAAGEYLTRCASEFPGVDVKTFVTGGAPGDVIVQHLRDNPVDLVIMASRGRTGLTRAALGGVTEKVLQGPDPVLVFEKGEARSRLFDDAQSS